jgi:hypothetical protein
MAEFVMPAAFASDEAQALFGMALAPRRNAAEDGWKHKKEDDIINWTTVALTYAQMDKNAAIYFPDNCRAKPEFMNTIRIA